jgi:glycosyltransferase involved in cell wall biosynthesis
MKKLKIIRATTVPLSLDIFCNGLLKSLSEKYEVIAVSSPGPEMKTIAEREGVKTIEVPMVRNISVRHDIVSLWRLICLFHKEKPVMVHSMTPKAGLLCMMAAWLTRVPVRVHTFTGLVFPTSKGLKRTILKLTDSMTCACASHVISEGEGVKNDLLNNGITRKTPRVLGYGNVRGIDIDFYARRPEVMALAKSIKKDDVFTFLFVGRIVGDKGINELCHAIDRLSGISSVRLLLVGFLEETLDPISLASKAIIENNEAVVLADFKSGDELLAYYAAADCFVMPSYREGFPNTVIEAGAMGLPSIVTDINGSREIIIQGENGVIVPPRDADALYKAMHDMMKDQNGRVRMAGNARQMIVSRYEQGYVRKCLYDYYDEILG